MNVLFYVIEYLNIHLSLNIFNLFIVNDFFYLFKKIIINLFN
jgi:hypothetical protein